VNDELDSLCVAHSDLSEVRCPVGTDQHVEFVQQEDADWVLVCVENVFVRDAVLSGARQNDRIHNVNIT
jgi:hypothetical protein